jgi:ATP-dependent helicase/nuclease subunit B
MASALEAGVTLVVPSRQRAAAVRLAVAAAASQRSLALWRTPEVLPWNGWLAREFEAQRHRLGGARRLLRPTESWFIWRGIARKLAESHGLLAPAGLASALPRSRERVRDWQLRWAGDTGAESQLLRTAEQMWHGAAQELNAVDAADWSVLPPAAAGVNPTPVVLAGFGALGPARAAWLSERAARSGDDSAGPRAALQVHAALDPAAELEAAAAWCRARLTADPTARLLVIVPRLEQLRPRLERSFEEALEPPQTASGPAAFAIEGGQPLDGFPLVRVALGLLALGARPLSFAEFSALLRTPYLALAPPPAALQLELWLRAHNLTVLGATQLRALLPTLARTSGAAAGVAQRLLDCLPAPTEADSAGGWARRFAAQLQTAGWPGAAPLGSQEQQVRRRFDELLGDFAASGSVLARSAISSALPLLEALTRDTAYEPASDDVPVTLSARLEDPIVRYDGIWICGCDATQLPGPARPDAFIPLSVQLAAGLPEASAEGQLARARAALAACQAATPELVLSWARHDEDAEQGPSGLLTGGTRRDVAASRTAPAGSVPLEAIPDLQGPRWPQGRRIGGGVQALQWQAECPFRAFAQLRLAAAPITEPAAGVDPRLRGRLLHRALDALWGELRDSTALQSLTAAAQAARIDAAVQSALAAELRAVGAELPALLQAAECRRACAIIAELLQSERARAPFRVIATEAQRPLALGAATLALRLDRIDQLADGGIAVLDYKSGRAEGFDPHAERLRRPQLPSYALAWDGEVAAVASVHLRRDGVKWRGVADSDGRLPALRAAVRADGEWRALLARWRSGLTALLQEFTSGCAAVAPLPGACDYCHLAALCRVDSARLAEGGGEGAGDADGG